MRNAQWYVPSNAGMLSLHREKGLLAPNSRITIHHMCGFLVRPTNVDASFLYQFCREVQRLYLNVQLTQL